MPPKKKAAKDKASKPKAIAHSFLDIQNNAASTIQAHVRRHLAGRTYVRRDSYDAQKQKQQQEHDSSTVMAELDARWQEERRATRQPGYFATLLRGGSPIKSARREPLSKFEELMRGHGSDYELVGEIVRRAELKRIRQDRVRRAEEDAAYAAARKAAYRELSRSTPTGGGSPVPVSYSPPRQAPMKKALLQPVRTPSVTSSSIDSQRADERSDSPAVAAPLATTDEAPAPRAEPTAQPPVELEA